MIAYLSQRLRGVMVFSILLAVAAIAAPAAALAESAPPVINLGPSTSPSGATCNSYTFQVLQNPGETVRQPVWGQLCYRGSLAGKPVQVLIHGGAYNHTYWDIPYRPQQYSYVEQATNQGYATLNFDRLGYGQSAHPNPLTLNFTVAGYVTHQLVTALRQGSLGPKFSTVILNGHSMGAAAADNEAENYSDINGLIVSGIGHELDPEVEVTVGSKLYPAELDPKFAGHIPPGYLTTIPGQRAGAFVEPGLIEPGMVAVEETTLKDTLSPNELTTLFEESYNPTLTRKITVPVLFAQGEFDELWCLRTKNCRTDPTSAAEASYYSPGVSFTHIIIPQAGHSINVSITAPAFYAQTFAWLAVHGLNR
jgi:pimeloyl-ACP methyl ester carboxylesterase